MKKKDLVGLVHGDDFVFVGSDEDLKWVPMVLKVAGKANAADVGTNVFSCQRSRFPL